jgi:hypothetical protein
MMKLDSSILPEGYGTGVENGLNARFHRDGSLAFYGNYRNGVPKGWVLTVNEHGTEAAVELREEHHYPDEEEGEAPSDEAAFRVWVEHWIGEVHSESLFSISCSFCGKKQHEVKKLIAGPKTYICNECIGLCNDILAEEENLSPG